MAEPSARAVAAALLLGAAPASAQTSYLRGPDGHDAGRVERGSDGTLRFYESTGRNAGRAEPGGPGVQRLYDRDGRPAGEIMQQLTTGTAWRPDAPPSRGRPQD